MTEKRVRQATFPRNFNLRSSARVLFYEKFGKVKKFREIQKSKKNLITNQLRLNISTKLHFSYYFYSTGKKIYLFQ